MYRHFRSNLIVSVILGVFAFSLVGQVPNVNAQDVLTMVHPIADPSCRISNKSREARIKYIENLIKETDANLVVAEKSLKTFQEALEGMNNAGKAANVCFGIALVAGTIAGVAAVYEVFFAGQVVTFFGISSQSVVKGLTVAGAASRAVSIPAGILYLLHNKPVYASDLPPITSHQIQELKKQKFLSDSTTRFLSEPDCSAKDSCVVDQDDLFDAFQALRRWHEYQAQAVENSEGAWYNPMAWEWRTHHYALSLAEVEIPWAMNFIDLTKMKRAYYEKLLSILNNDRAACSTGMGFGIAVTF